MWTKKWIILNLIIWSGAFISWYWYFNDLKILTPLAFKTVCPLNLKVRENNTRWMEVHFSVVTPVNWNLQGIPIPIRENS